MRPISLTANMAHLLFFSVLPRRTTSMVISRAASSMATSASIPFTPMPLFYNDHYEVALPKTHKFPMEKYRLVRRRLQLLLGPGKLASFSESPLATPDDLATVHCPDYVQRFVSGGMSAAENRAVGFPWSQETVNRALSSAGGTVAAAHAVCRARAALLESHRHHPAGNSCDNDGDKDDDQQSSSNRPSSIPRVSGHLAGGTHHAFRDRGEGFCVFSDIAVASGVALRDYPNVVQRILIVDLDVHQGNGNAAIFRDDSRVFTFSVHCAQNLFSAKEFSDCDVELAAGCGDNEYLKVLESKLDEVLSKAQPDLIFYQSGVDGLNIDRLGKLNLTPEGIQRRDALVFDKCLNWRRSSSSDSLLHGTGKEETLGHHEPDSSSSLRRKSPAASNAELGPIMVVTMGGGYPNDLEPTSMPFKNLVTAHADVFVAAARKSASLQLSLDE